MTNSKNQKKSFTTVKRKYVYVFMFFLVIFLTLFVYLSVYRTTVFNLKFYQGQYEANGVYERFDKNAVDNFTLQFFDYVDSREVYMNNSAMSLSDKDVNHLVDVKNLMREVNFLHILFGVVAVLAAIAMHQVDKNNFFKDMAYVLMATGILIVLITLIALIGQNAFSGFFNFFHESAFSNDLWKMNPRFDMLVNLYPNQFFFNFVKRVVVYGLINGLIILAAGVGLWYMVKKKVVN